MLKKLELHFHKFPNKHGKLLGKRLLWQGMVCKIDSFLLKLKGLDSPKI